MGSQSWSSVLFLPHWSQSWWSHVLFSGNGESRLKFCTCSARGELKFCTFLANSESKLKSCTFSGIGQGWNSVFFRESKLKFCTFHANLEPKLKSCTFSGDGYRGSRLKFFSTFSANGKPKLRYFFRQRTGKAEILYLSSQWRIREVSAPPVAHCPARASTENRDHLL
jgi:hypothetical protein